MLDASECEQSDLIRAGEAAPSKFELVTVDGDHTALGTWWDLVDVVPHIAVGGVLVIDDFVDSANELLGDRATRSYEAIRTKPDDLKPSLLGLWHMLKEQLPDWEFIESFDSIVPIVPIGIAVHMR